jgi:hypothetical protein
VLFEAGQESLVAVADVEAEVEVEVVVMLEERVENVLGWLEDVMLEDAGLDEELDDALDDVTDEAGLVERVVDELDPVVLVPLELAVVERPLLEDEVLDVGVEDDDDETDELLRPVDEAVEELLLGPEVSRRAP